MLLLIINANANKTTIKHLLDTLVTINILLDKPGFIQARMSKIQGLFKDF